MANLNLKTPSWLSFEGNSKTGIPKIRIRKAQAFEIMAKAMGLKLDKSKPAFGLTRYQISAMKRAIRKFCTDIFGNCSIKLTGKEPGSAHTDYSWSVKANKVSKGTIISLSDIYPDVSAELRRHVKLEGKS